MNLAALSEPAFLGALTKTGATTGTAAELIGGYGIDRAAAFPILRDYGVFRIVSLRSGDTGLQDASGMLVGAYIGDIVMIDHQTLAATVRGASVPLILYAAAERLAPPTSRIVSPHGEAALRCAAPGGWRMGLKLAPGGPESHRQILDQCVCAAP